MPPSDPVLNRELNRLASTHYGLLNRQLVLEAGGSAQFIRTKIARGDWARLTKGVYQVGTVDLNIEPTRAALQRIMKSILRLRFDCLASHGTAAWLWGLVPDVLETVDLSVARLRNARSFQGTRLHRCRDFGLIVPSRVRRITCTNPLRTLMDIAAVGDEELLAGCLDEALNKHLVNPAGLRAELERSGGQGRPGTSAMKRVGRRQGWLNLVPEMSRSESELERLMVTLLKDAGLPSPIAQFRLGPERYRADFAYPASGLIIETDGFGAHSSKRAFQGDRTRQNELVNQGWRVLRYTWSDLTNRPGDVVMQIRSALDGPRTRGPGVPPTVRSLRTAKPASSDP